MAHLTLAANERAFNKVVDRAKDYFHPTASGSGSFGPFSVSYNAGVHLGTGTVDLQNDGTVRIKELDIIYEPLNVNFGIDIPTITIGGFCIIPNPFGGCLLRAPRITLFGANPDINVPINFDGLFQSEISGAFKLIPKYFNNPAKGTLSDHDAHDLAVANQWQFYLDPEWVDIDIIDVADTIGNLIQRITDEIINALLGWAPAWARAIVRAILAPVISAIRAILDIGDDIDEWLSNLFGVSLGLFDFVAGAVADFFASKFPIFDFEEPFQIMNGSGTLIPVLVPVRDVAVNVNDVEMVITSNFS
jgi:hypothetical protein